MYGLTLLVAILACIWLTGRRWTAMGGDWDLVTRVAVWGVGFGVLGARLYHDVTSWSEVPSPKWQGIGEVWKGGLGIWGGILFGALAGAIVIRRAGANVPVFLDAAAPGLLLAQGIGRIGNWWNQELYGKQTTLPWGLEIHGKTVLYHPTFLYELIWDVLGVLVLLWVDRRFQIKRPGLFALYVSWYTAFRTYEEVLRIDPSTHFLGQRLNFWVSLVIFVLSTAFFIWWQFLRRPEDEPRTPKAKKQPKARPQPKGPHMAVPKGRVR
jgi:prolipoprotein diacylglyceryl transferase